jgi:PilZ domain
VENILWKTSFSSPGLNGSPRCWGICLFADRLEVVRQSNDYPDPSQARPHIPKTITRLWRFRNIDMVSPQSKLGTNVDRVIERRNSRRFQIALPLLLRWTDNGNHYDSGHCLNIGQGGMFLLAAKTLPLGGDVEIEFVLPPFSSVPRPTRLHCVGRVSRIEVCYQLKGFAVAGRFVNQLRAEPDMSMSFRESPDVGC